MNKLSFCIACAVILPQASAAIAQDKYSLSLGATAGVTAMNLPSTTTGVFSSGSGNFSNTIGGLTAGFEFGLSSGLSLGKFGDLDAALGLAGFAAFTGSSFSVTDSFTGPGVVVIPGYSTPANTTILLTTGSTPVESSARSQIGHVNPQGGVVVSDVENLANPNGGVNSYAVTAAPGDNSFGYGAVATQHTPISAADTAAAYGAVAATDGGIFIGAGDLTGLTITTSGTRAAIFTGADLTLALSSPTDDNGLIVQGYAGPSYRYLGQRIDTTVSVNIPEAVPTGGTVFPTYSMDRSENLVSHYLGGIVGGSLTAIADDGVSFTLGGEAGLYHVSDSFAGRESYSVSGGLPTVVGPITVTNANGASGSSNGVAWALGGDGTVTVPVAERQQISLSLGVDYLSRVATLSRSGGASIIHNYAPGSDDGAALYNAPSSGNTILSFGGMWKLSASVSFTGQF